MNPIKKEKKRKIGKYDDNDNLIEVFNSVRECRKTYGNVSRALAGKVSHCKGYKFKYID